jgi:hypothetical protein
MTGVGARVLTRRGAVVLLALAVVAALGVWRAGDRIGLVSSDDDRYSRLCRDRGGTPAIAPGSGDYVKDSRSCEVRYGAHTYEMYAITPNGFDEREATSARRACASQARLDRQLGARRGTPSRRVWHPRTAVCEAEP